MTGFALLAALAANPTGAGALDDAEQVLALGPRVAGTPGGQAAQDWVVGQLQAAGYTPHVRRAADGAGAVLACTGEPDGAGWLLAHTDTVHADCPGAVDNAGAVAVALGVARSLRAEPPPGPVCVVFPDGEEQGLLGSRALAARYTPAWVVSLELIGQGAPTAMGLGPAWGTAGLGWLSRHGLAIPWAYRVHSRLLPDGERSDHGPFAARGVLGLLILGRAPAGIYWRYHTAQDDLAQLDPAALAQTRDVVEGLLREGPPAQQPDAALQLPWTHRVLPGSLLVLFTGAGLLGGAAGGWRGGWAALRGLGVAAAAAAVGGAAWVIALHGRPGEGALAAPGLLAWAAGAAALLAWVPQRPHAARGGALLCTLAGCAFWPFDLLLALPFGLAAAGLALAGRWPGMAVLALPLPLYLTWPDHWRELVFHGLMPASPLAWLPVLALLWAPLACGWQGVRWRPSRGIAAGVALGVTLWAALQPAWSDAWPAREALRPW